MKEKKIYLYIREKKCIPVGKLLTTEDLFSCIYQIPLFTKILPNFYKFQIAMLCQSKFFSTFSHFLTAFQMEKNIIFISFGCSEEKTKTNRK